MKIRTDFVTNSSSSSYCVAISVFTTDDNEYSLLVEPHDGGADSSIFINDNEFENLYDSKSVSELCHTLIEILEINDDVESSVDNGMAFLDEKEEEEVVAAFEEKSGENIDLRAEDWFYSIVDIIKREPDVIKKIELLSILSKDYKNLLNEVEEYILNINKKIDETGNIKDIEFKLINSAWGEFANENFWRIIGTEIDIGEYELGNCSDKFTYLYDHVGMIRELRKVFDKRCDFENLKEPLRFMDCESYYFVRSYTVNLCSRTIIKTKYFEDSYASPRVGELEYNLGYKDDIKLYQELGDFVFCGDVLIEYKGNDTEVVIPKGIEIIGNSAFRSNSRLVKVSFPVGLTYIGDSAFYECCNLKTLNLPEKIKHIGSCAFQNCEFLKRITFHEGITDISQSAFKGCCSLEKVVLKNGLKTIKQEAFADCLCLEKLILPDSIETIEKQAFMGCTCLKSVEMPNKDVDIAEDAFKECIFLEE